MLIHSDSTTTENKIRHVAPIVTAEDSARQLLPNGKLVLLPKNYDATKDPAYITWITRQEGRRGRPPSEAPIVIRRWAEFTGHTLTELVDLRKQHLASQDDTTRQWEESKLEEFLAFLANLKDIRRTRKGRLSRGSILTHWGRIHSFYAYHKLDLKDKSPQSWTETEYHPCTIEDIREVYAVADVCARFVLNVLTSTGLSNEDLALMRLGSILAQSKTQERIIVRLSRAKTKVPFRTVLGQTCVQDLKAYLQYRQSKGEQLSAESALIVGERQGVVDYRDVYRIIRTPAQQAGKPWFTPKLIRKVFNQVVKNKGFHDHAEYWMGHKLPTERAAYFSNMPDKEMIEAYRKVEKDLNIKDSGLVVADESRLKLDIMLDTIKFSHPELHSEFLRLRQERETQGRALSTKEALAWLNTESMKRGPTGGLAWTQLNKKDKLAKVLAQLAEVLGEPEDS